MWLHQELNDDGKLNLIEFKAPLGFHCWAVEANNNSNRICVLCLPDDHRSQLKSQGILERYNGRALEQ